MILEFPGGAIKTINILSVALQLLLSLFLFSLANLRERVVRAFILILFALRLYLLVNQ